MTQHIPDTPHPVKSTGYEYFGSGSSSTTYTTTSMIRHCTVCGAANSTPSFDHQTFFPNWYLLGKITNECPGVRPAYNVFS